MRYTRQICSLWQALHLNLYADLVYLFQSVCIGRATSTYFQAAVLSGADVTRGERNMCARRSKEAGMADKKGNRQTGYTIYDDQTTGTVQIADEVVAMIGALAATEVEGVASIGGGVTYEKIPRSSAKTLARGIKIDVLEQVASVRVILNMKYGYNIPEVSAQVQERIKSTIETMTGLQVADVNISVADVTVDRKK